MDNQNALNAYAAKMEAIRMRLEELTEWADNMGNVSPDDVQWPDVGSAGRVQELLDEAASFLGLTSEREG